MIWGKSLGVITGDNVGDRVGNLVGDNVGDRVGNLVGALVGDFVGAADFVGLSVMGIGVGVGLNVGNGDIVGDGGKIILFVSLLVC